MALIITKAVTELYDTNVTDSSGGAGAFKAAQADDPEALRLFAPRPLTFSAEGTSLGNEAVTLALLAPVNLTALGVLFPASTLRNIRVRCWSRRVTVAEAGYSERIFTVIGGATPSIPPRFTLAAGLTAANDPQLIIGIPNNNSAAAPEYGEGVVIMDAVATASVIVGVQNFLGTTNAAVTTTVGMRWRLEVVVDPLVSLPVFS